MTGYVKGRLLWTERLLLFAGGLLLIVPSIWSDVLGMTLLLTILFLHVKKVAFKDSETHQVMEA